MGNVTAATIHGQLQEFPTMENCGKERRYMLRKNNSFAAQKVNRTFYNQIPSLLSAILSDHHRVTRGERERKKEKRAEIKTNIIRII